MTVLLDRWQFAVTILYHFLFVPLTIGLGLLVAVMQTLAYRRQDPEWDRLARFFGRLFLINFAMGVVTGIVQEFQFGMNWSNYSIFVGNIFGAPLAMEGLLAFFVESTFLGLWIFGRHKLSPRLHLACIWLVSLGTMLSAFFILAANSWMQHPVGYRIVDHKAVLTDIWAVLGNSTLWVEFPHTLLAAFVTGGMVLLGVSAWKLLRHRGTGHQDVGAFTRAAKLAAAFSLVAVLATMVTGDLQARLMDEQQPMKMAAAEALYNTEDGASFSLLTVGNLSGNPVFQIRVPHLLSLIADMSWNGRVEGIHQTQAAEAARYGPGSYVPVVWLTYWSFRLMVGLGMVILAVSGWALVLARMKRLDRSRLFARVALVATVTPFLANSFGWIFTEMGRQPWVVYGLMKTDQAMSPAVGTGSVALTLGGFTLLYTVLGVVDGWLMARSARRPLTEPEPDDEHGPDAEPALVY
ncbi:MAG TPA: cytochrome ubiquinol oxidase subunit I [Acidimicrobiales bacterium]|nr:cytochrome ubiquinol oxidase subunit I [Acidimicrobiales bacterium]